MAGPELLGQHRPPSWASESYGWQVGLQRKSGAAAGTRPGGHGATGSKPRGQELAERVRVPLWAQGMEHAIHMSGRPEQGGPWAQAGAAHLLRDCHLGAQLGQGTPWHPLILEPLPEGGRSRRKQAQPPEPPRASSHRDDLLARSTDTTSHHTPETQQCWKSLV